MESSGGGAKVPEPFGQSPDATSSAAAASKCESCRSAPGTPFCRVEWSFLCSGCASGVHGHDWVVPVPPNAAHNPNLPHFPYFPYPYPHFASPSSDPNVAAHHSSDEDDLSTARWHAAGMPAGMPAAYRRLECVMRYREKRRSRKFEKAVRHENRRAYAEVRPMMDGRFSGREAGGHPGMEGEGRVRYVGIKVSELKTVAGGELRGAAAGGEELGQPDFMEDVRLQ